MQRTFIVVTVAALAFAGCAGTQSGPSGAPLSAIGDAKAHTDLRIKAIDRVNQAIADGEIDLPAARDALKRAAWSRSTWWKVRAAAINALLGEESMLDDTRNMLRLMLPTETDGEIVRLVCAAAAERGWTDLAPAIVRRWSRPDKGIDDDKRPERAALAKLFPNVPVEDAVFAAFIKMPAGQGKEAERQERVRLDAWGLLRRIDKQERTATLLSNMESSNDPLISVLQRGAKELRCVPDTGSELAWLARLGEPDRSAWWGAASEAAAALGQEQAARLKLRHLPIVLWTRTAHPEWLAMTRAALIEDLKRICRERKHCFRGGQQGGASGVGETVEHYGDLMSWGDVLGARVASEVVSDVALRAELFKEAEADQADSSTEYGGVVTAPGVTDRAGISAVLFPPRATERFGDRQFVPSLDMVRAGDTALFHYHFHVNKWNNADYAGPSQGDLDSAADLGRACLVFTAIDKNTLNADYYQGDTAKAWAVIDVGNISRP